MRFARTLFATAWVGVVACHATADETGVNRIYGEFVRGDYVTAGTSTRVRESSAKSDPVQVEVSGIPVGATVVKAYANWSYMADEAWQTDTLLIDGNVVTGNLSGSGNVDLVWGYEKALAYTADVTGIVTANGGYDVSGALDDPRGYWIGQGVSFVVVYELDSMPMQAVHIYDGYFSTMTGSGQGVQDYIAEYTDGTAHFYTNGIDGQVLFTDDFFVNGVRASDDFGLGGVNNAWRGTLGPDLAGMNFYDHAEGDASRYMGAGNVSLSYMTAGFSNNAGSYTDAVGHSFSAMAFQAVPEPSSLAALGIAASALASRRRRPLRTDR